MKDKYLHNLISLLICFISMLFLEKSQAQQISKSPEKSHAQQISKSFELRYFSSDTSADGETDFKGPTEVFDTRAADNVFKCLCRYATQFFNDARLNKQVISSLSWIQPWHYLNLSLFPLKKNY